MIKNLRFKIPWWLESHIHTHNIFKTSALQFRHKCQLIQVLSICRVRGQNFESHIYFVQILWNGCRLGRSMRTMSKTQVESDGVILLFKSVNGAFGSDTNFCYFKWHLKLSLDYWIRFVQTLDKNVLHFLFTHREKKNRFYHRLLKAAKKNIKISRNRLSTL